MYLGKGLPLGWYLLQVGGWGLCSSRLGSLTSPLCHSAVLIQPYRSLSVRQVCLCWVPAVCALCPVWGLVGHLPRFVPLWSVVNLCPCLSRGHLSADASVVAPTSCRWKECLRRQALAGPSPSLGSLSLVFMPSQLLRTQGLIPEWVIGEASSEQRVCHAMHDTWRWLHWSGGVRL